MFDTAQPIDGWPRLWLPLVLMAGFMFAAATLGATLTRDGQLATVWLADAALLTLLVRSARRRWPIVIAVAFVTLIPANIVAGTTALALIIGLPLCNIAGVVPAALVIRRAWRHAPNPTDGRTLLAILIGGGFVAPVVSGALATVLLAGAVDAPPLATFEHWIAADALGILLVAPLLLGLSMRLLHSLDTATVALGAAIVMLNAGVATFVFSTTGQPLLFLIAPGLILAAFRARFLGAATSVLMVAMIATTLTLAGEGPIATTVDGDAATRVLLLQLFLVTMLLMVLPVSAILDAQERLAASLEENNGLLLLAERTARMGHWRLDKATRAVRWSDNVHTIRGTTPGEGTMAQGVATYLPEDQDRVRRLVTNSLETGEPLSFRARVVRTDGIEVPVAIEGVAERGVDGAIIGIFGVMQDVTQQSRAEEELKAALAEAEQATRVKSDFLAMMSHEIRTPMTGVLGMIELLRTEPRGPERERYFATLDQSARVLLAVLNDVLDYSRLESGAIRLEAAAFDLHRVVTNVIDLFHSSASARGLLVTAELPDSHPLPVTGDAVRVQQVLSNLVGNAIKFTNAGSIVIRVAVPGDDDDCWSFEVADTGIGIEADTLDRLFEPFVQADASTVRRFGGSGLGLAICRRLVEAMGGEISVVSTPGAGSSFRFRLPLAIADATALEEARALPAAVEMPPLAVLLAEDNEVVALLAIGLLERMGHRVTRVANGRAAVEAAARGGFDAILMDMQMPELDGLEATLRIRALPGAAGAVPIIALTADAAPARRGRYLDVGLTDFLGKPIDPAALAAALAGIAAPGDKTPLPHAAEPPLLDPDRIADTASVLGDAGTIRLLGLLRADCGHRSALVLDHYGGGDLEAMRREAHALAGAAETAGAARLGAIARAVMDEDLDESGLPPLLTRLGDTATATQRAIEAVTGVGGGEEQQAAE